MKFYCIDLHRFNCNIRSLQICRDINEIKVCMETGKTVIMLNMESLYESLYDALNQASKDIWYSIGLIDSKCRTFAKI